MRLTWPRPWEPAHGDRAPSFSNCLGLVYSCSSQCWIRQRDGFVAQGELIILHPFFLTCNGYRSSSVFLTRSVCSCSSAQKGWLLSIFLISVLALPLLGVVLVWDLQLEVISLCQDIGQSGDQGLCCGWFEMLEQIDGWTQRFIGWFWDFGQTLENTLVQSWFFWSGTHFSVRITFCIVRYNVRLIIMMIKIIIIKKKKKK